jgi:SAM-dependent methyltransferase
MSLRFHEIAERYLRVLNPLLPAQLDRLAQKCRVRAGLRHLDLACGKGELLCQWAKQFGTIGTGVDISHVFIAAAQERIAELGLQGQVTCVQGDAAAYAIAPQQYDLISCLGATWIGGGFVGTLQMLAPGLRDADSLMLLGHPFWRGDVPDIAYESYDPERNAYTTLAGTLDWIEQNGFELIDMELANLVGWDHYSTNQWHSVSDWLREHPDDPDAAALRDWIAQSRREYLTFGREHFGWGVFVLRRGAV